MRSVLCLTLAAALFSCKDKGAEPASATATVTHKPHAPVTGSAKYRVDIDALTVQALSEAGNPTGDEKTVTERPNGVYTCSVAQDPGSAPVSLWMSGPVDAQGRIGFDLQDETVAQDVLNCARVSLVNMKLPVPVGMYKITAQVSFSEPKR